MKACAIQIPEVYAEEEERWQRVCRWVEFNWELMDNTLEDPIKLLLIVEMN